MQITPTALPEVLLIGPKVFGDTRGFFLESWNEIRFNQALGYGVKFVQDNHSRSTRRVLRGLHYQLHPHAQGKLVRCVSGTVFDVAVDLRRSSPNFGRWVGHELSAENRLQMWIPPGFAHGFVVLSDSADFLYKTSGEYAPEYEGSVRWNDPTIGIAWPLDGLAPQLSPKDEAAPLLADARTFD
ncbi:dTDP-4-dehydrorhamnose 3,5-epimerase [Roseateles sp.]|uniref:dTDP-4-dehydrorhamnose 3,5-epimerase n=1 Tax=Roseateles sp. TaxID=1971397 RepID=UPI0025DAC1A5|nr:dTDP-4-dehydrorhamnose 3,5-epimerase [Roseateles sp.]MBV8033908.1 dTDP-4-dehydrorhamnose 3,5-epimerase [Roseateles sp.]